MPSPTRWPNRTASRSSRSARSAFTARLRANHGSETSCRATLTTRVPPRTLLAAILREGALAAYVAPAGRQGDASVSRRRDEQRRIAVVHEHRPAVAHARAPVAKVAERVTVAMRAIDVKDVDLTGDLRLRSELGLQTWRTRPATPQLRRRSLEGEMVAPAVLGRAFPLARTAIVAGVRIDRDNRYILGGGAGEHGRGAAPIATDLHDLTTLENAARGVPKASGLLVAKPARHLSHRIEGPLERGSTAHRAAPEAQRSPLRGSPAISGS